MRDRLAQAAADRYKAWADAGTLLTLVEDPVTLVRGQPVSARELLSRYDKDPNGARKRAERDEAARAAAEYAANRQATILAEQKLYSWWGRHGYCWPDELLPNGNAHCVGPFHQYFVCLHFAISLSFKVPFKPFLIYVYV